MVAGTCPRCGGAVALHEGRPFVNLAGAIELWHSSCFDDRDVLVHRSTAVDFLPRPLTPGLCVVLGGAVVGSLLFAFVVGQGTWGEMAPPPPASLANLDLGTVAEPVVRRLAEAEHEQVPPRQVT